ncbi:lachrymatory-factor synthase-like [Cicer arietinum]|uniref:Lachrymatory-factor synthase-like n=1 Tax=Cicer arietinum TaxID=3827 RepID=A0A1S2Y8J8_CICAR|nr:lachrymatory-factor synthase-like [Cicer arietinum]
MAKEIKQKKWEGKDTVEIRGVDGEIVWHVLEDFCNLHKWIPIDTCYKIGGIEGQPGLIRYCASAKKGVTKDAEPTIKWFKEKLLKIDPIQRCLSYEIVDNNMGFKNYVAIMKVLPLQINGGDDGKSEGCMIEWSCVCDPIEGWSLQDLNNYIGSFLKSLGNKIQLAYSYSPSKI